MAAGRPRKEIGRTEFEKLCELQCTLEEIAGFFDCCEDTIETWCKREYGEKFSEISAKKRAAGKICLRRYQLQLAKKSASMAIWLGKQWLGQREMIEYEDKEAIERLDAILEGIKGNAEQTAE